jgi:hypothetical protein
MLLCDGVPQCEVQYQGHADAIEEDEGPENDKCLFACAQGVIKRRRVLEGCIGIRDLSGCKTGVWMLEFELALCFLGLCSVLFLGFCSFRLTLCFEQTDHDGCGGMAVVYRVYLEGDCGGK